jgi:hypothetical protein
LTSRSGLWNWVFLPSNLSTEPTTNPFAKEILLAKDRIPAIDRFPFKGPPSSTHDFLSVSKTNDPATKGKAKSSTSPKKTKTGEREFTAAELGQYILQGLPGLHDSEESSTFEHNIQQAKSEKVVRFFKDNTYDKHFIPIPVDLLVDHDNWREWMVAMQLLFVQHGVWDVVIGEIIPLSASHTLHLWYQRLCDCVVGLVFANVSKPIRKHLCFLGAAAENDPEALIQCLWVHYSDPNGEKVPH